MEAAKRGNAGGPRYGSSLKNDFGRGHGARVKTAQASSSLAIEPRAIANASKHSAPARVTQPTEPFAVANGSDHSIQYDALNPQIRGHRNQSSGFLLMLSGWIHWLPQMVLWVERLRLALSLGSGRYRSRFCSGTT